ncbi:MAG: hypothetical protein ACO1QB_12020 [Verrucomicrobiales bacterium]
MKKLELIPVFILGALLGTGCNQSSQPAEDQSALRAEAKDLAAPSAKPGALPHGGAPVQIGPHDYHLELVNDPTEGKMTAYVLDDHAEKPKNVSPTTFEMLARFGGTEQRLTFQPLTNATSANISAFAASADWLKTATNFDGEIPTITLGGETFQNIKFSYPKGVKHSH